MSVRVRKGGFMARPKHSDINLFIYCPSLCQREAPGDHGRPMETTRDHRGQFPRTDFGWIPKPSPPTTPPGPLKLRFFDKYIFQNILYIYIYLYIYIHTILLLRIDF